MGRPRGVLGRWRTVAAVTLAATASIALIPGPANAAPTGTAERRALVLQLTWAAGNGSPATPVDRTLSEVAGLVHGARNWYRTVSHGHFPAWRVRGMGPIEISPPHMDPTGVCGPSFENDVRNLGRQAVIDQGYDLSIYDVVVFYFSAVTQCGWSGLGGPGNVWINGSSGFKTSTVVQELGHHLGLGHGNAWICRDANGGVVTLSSNCHHMEYGDPFNAMGTGQGSFSAIQQFDLGWMDGRIMDIPTTGGTYTIQPLEFDAVSPQVLRLAENGVTLWMEYRQPIGVDAYLASNPDGPGVMIRAEIPGQRRSLLLDMTPNSYIGFADARLPVGGTFINPLGTTKITVVSNTPDAAVIRVESMLVPVPDVRGYTVTAATNALVAAGFVRGSISQIVDNTCNNIGLVVRQQPAAGTRVLPGTAVQIAVGKKPSHPCP